MSLAPFRPIPSVLEIFISIVVCYFLTLMFVTIHCSASVRPERLMKKPTTPNSHAVR